MGADIVARGLAVRSLDRLGPTLSDHGELSTTDEQATRIAFRDAFRAGVDRLTLAPGRYLCGTIPSDEDVVLQTYYQQPAVILPLGFKRLDGRGAELVLFDGRGILAASYETWAHPTAVAELASPVQAGDTQVQLVPGDGALWQPGDLAVWRFGSLPYDKPETLDWGMAHIKAVDGDTVTLDRPLPAPFDPASVDGDPFTNPGSNTPAYNRSLHRWPLFEDLEFLDLTASGMEYSDYETWAEEFIKVRGGRRIHVARCGARRVGIAFSFQYVDGVTLTDCWAEDAVIFQPSVGKGINLGECRDVEIRNFRGKGLRKCIHLEAGAEARVYGGSFANTGHRWTGSYGSNCIVFGAVSRSQLTVRDFTITGFGGYQLTSVQNGFPEYDGTVEFEGRLTLIHPTDPHSLQPSQIRGLLDYRVGGGRELWDFRRPKLWRRRIYLRNGLFQHVLGPRGIISNMRVYASSGLTFGTSGQLISFFIGREGVNGVNRVDSLQAGAETTLTFAGGALGGIIWSLRAEPLKILVRTESGTSLDTADAYLDIECDLAVDRLASPPTWASDEDQRNAGPDGGLREAFFPAYDIPSVPGGGAVTLDLPVPAATSTDLIESVDFAGNLEGLSLRDVDSVSGAVRVTFANHTAAASDPAPADIRILWRRSLTSG